MALLIVLLAVLGIINWQHHVHIGKLFPDTFTATFFGYDCNTTFGSNCTNRSYCAGVVVVQAILITSTLISSMIDVSIRSMKPIADDK